MRVERRRCGSGRIISIRLINWRNVGKISSEFEIASRDGRSGELRGRRRGESDGGERYRRIKCNNDNGDDHNDDINKI